MIEPGKLRVAVAGAGRWTAASHIPSVLAHPRAELVALAEPLTDRREMAADRFSVPGFATVEEMVAADLADALVVGSPPAAHHGAAMLGLEARLHVLVEKPMTVEPADAWGLVEAARRVERHLVVGYTFQFTQHAARARELVAGGAIGQVQLVEASYASGMRARYEGVRRPGDRDDPLDRPAPGTFDDPALSGGGQAATQASHVMASVLATSGLAVETVSAQTRAAGLHVDLVDAAVLELSDGAIGTLNSTGNLDPAQEQHWHVRYYGAEGVVVHDLRAGTLALHDRLGGVQRPKLPSEQSYPARAPAASLIDLALGADENPAPGELGARTVEVVDALYRSAAAGGARVDTSSAALRSI